MAKDYTQKIDFHSHYCPPAYMEYLEKYIGPMPDSFPTPSWSMENHLKEMDKLGVAFSLMSISSPALSEIGNTQIEVDYARRINDEGAAFMSQHPDKVAFMAELPLPHVEESLAEAKRALDELGAWGFGFKTNYAGVYLGDPELDPVMEFLNERNAIVVIHPTTPGDFTNKVTKDFPIPAMEFFMDTTRTFVNMHLHDTFKKYPNIKWVEPHAGAFLAILDDRIANFRMFTKKVYPKAKLDVYSDMKHVYFDLAGFPLKKQLQILRKDVPIEHMLYGSDCPYTPEPVCIALAGELENTNQLSDDEKYAIFTKNALEVCPQLADKLKVNNAGESTKHRGRKAGRKKRKLFGRVYDKGFDIVMK